MNSHPPAGFTTNLTIMVKSEEKSLTAPLPTSHGRKTRKASRTGAAARLPIVQRAQIRLPNELAEAVCSAPATPVNYRKEMSISRLVEEEEGDVKATATTPRKVPKSVASMVRR